LNSGSVSLANKVGLELVEQAKPFASNAKIRGAKGKRESERERGYYRNLSLDISGRLLEKGGMISLLYIVRGSTYDGLIPVIIGPKKRSIKEELFTNESIKERRRSEEISRK